MALPAIQSPAEEQLRPITFEEYRALPDDGPRFELIYGELFMAAAPKTIHQRVAFRLAILLQDHVESNGLGEVFIAPFDVRFSNYSAVQPDIVFVSTANEHRIGEDYLIGSPDLVVEVLSPSNRAIDLVRKRVLYGDHGVPEYWIVDPIAASIRICLLDGERYAERVFDQDGITSSTFPRLKIDFAALFRVQGRTSGPSGLNEDGSEK